MDISLDFFPNAARARQIDRRMRGQLAHSLGYLACAMTEQGGESHPELDRLVAALQAGAVYPPSTFGLYYELAAALMGGDEASAASLLDELSRERAMAACEVDVLALDRIFPETNRVRYQRLMDTDPDTPFRIVSPPAVHVDPAIQRFRSGMTRLRQTLPELAGEFEALIRQVVLVAGADDLDYGFAGGSCYMLWGALFINASAHDSDVATIEAIAHESGHSLLFGLTVDEPLVLNDDRERFASPLRDDPRPMDGIYHATYVSARMHWAMAELLKSGTLGDDEAALATVHLDANRRNFWSGYATVVHHARLSETGRCLLASAHDYMKAYSSE
ncbi:MAG: HEXXH motif-containing putative peptide modification protein [Pseudomonadota bacterium]